MINKQKEQIHMSVVELSSGANDGANKLQNQTLKSQSDPQIVQFNQTQQYEMKPPPYHLHKIVEYREIMALTQQHPS